MFAEPVILVIDDDVAVRSSLRLLLRQAGYRVAVAEDPAVALSEVERRCPDLAILDMNFSISTSGEEGLELLRKLRADNPQMPVILITAWASIPLAVEGMKAGAADFVSKPWSNSYLLQSIRTALSLSGSLSGEQIAPPTRASLDEQYDFSGLVGTDERLLPVLMTIGRVAPTDASVLITGESGTGKELVAEAIHANSTYCDGPFVKVNLGGISSSLFESEMFGHCKGAFTDAVHDRVGRFEMAHGGTIFLDEIGELSLNSQVKLLRVLQDRRFEVLGTSISKSIDFRLVCATNRDLGRMVASGTFREDLFYRINLIMVELPALRERPDDIPLLVQHFVNNLRTIYRRDNLTVSPEALKWLQNQPWPGNIRELKNVVERTVLISTEDLLDIASFQPQLLSGQRARSTDLPEVGALTIEEMEQSMIRKALEFHANNISRVARSLGLSRAALYRRLEKYGIEV